MTPSSRRSLALLVAVFVAGLLGGVAVDRAYVPKPPSGLRIRMKTPELFDRLDLTPAQRRAVDSVFRESSPRTEAAMREMVPRLAAIADSVNADLRRLLTPAQRAQFDSLTSGPKFLIKRKDSTGIARVDTIHPGSH